MADPRHITTKGSSACKRCGLSKHHGKYCPVGFWASKAQHKELDAAAAPPTYDEHTRRINELSKKWLAEWEKEHAGD